MPWIQLRIPSTAENADAISDHMMAVGAQAITFMDTQDTPIYEPKPGEVLFWAETTVIGLFDAEVDMDIVTTYLRHMPETDADHFTFKVEAVEDKDWEREWMENFHPIQFGKRLWICPSWRDIPDPDAVNVMLDPGLAFGTGTHPTTALCLSWLDGLDFTGKTVIDYGCGSGILAIAALKLGAEKAIGIDIDPQALQASQANAERNQVSDKLSLYLPEDAPDTQGDIVVANILAGPLKELAPGIISRVKEDGLLALSGLLESQMREVATYYQEHISLNDPIVKDEWARIDGQRKK